MDLIFEIVGEVLIEGSMEIIKNKNISKWIRYPLLILLTIFYSLIIGLFVFLGIEYFNENNLLSIFMFLIAIFLITMIIIIIKTNKNI